MDGEDQRRYITWTSLCFLTGAPSHMFADIMKDSDWRHKQGGTMTGIVFLNGVHKHIRLRMVVSFWLLC